MLNIEFGKMVKYHDQKWLIEGISDGYALLKAGHKKRKVKLEVLRYLELRDHQRNRAQ